MRAPTLRHRGEKEDQFSRPGRFSSIFGTLKENKKKRCDERIRRDIEYSHFRNIPRMGLGAQSNASSNHQSFFRAWSDSPPCNQPARLASGPRGQHQK